MFALSATAPGGKGENHSGAGRARTPAGASPLTRSVRTSDDGHCRASHRPGTATLERLRVSALRSCNPLCDAGAVQIGSFESDQPHPTQTDFWQVRESEPAFEIK